jgi:Uma2 family endonuclease
VTIKLILEGEKVLESPFTIIKNDVSEEEFWNFANEDIKCELIDGVLIIQSPANQEHEDIFSLLMTLFRYYLVNTKKGKVFGSRFVMRLSEKWNPEPDLLVVLSENLDNLEKGRLVGPADLVVEILSESTRKSDLKKKIPHFIKSGVQEVWVIDPEKKEITIHGKDGEKMYKNPGSEQIISSNVLPSMSIKAKWIWERDNHPTDEDFKFLVRSE